MGWRSCLPPECRHPARASIRSLDADSGRIATLAVLAGLGLAGAGIVLGGYQLLGVRPALSERAGVAAPAGDAPGPDTDGSASAPPTVREDGSVPTSPGRDEAEVLAPLPDDTAGPVL